MANATEVNVLPKFEHSTLPLPDDRHFRLLSIHADGRDGVECSLEIFSLDAHPAYNALSYTWASPFSHNPSDPTYSKTYEISINSQTYEVTKNLHDALLQLRHSCAGTKIWIDAVCIWQANLAERNSQVNLMDEIYGKAAKVLIWLGLDDAQTVKVAELVALLASIPEETTRLAEEKAREDRVEYGEGDGFEEIGLPGYWSPVWLSLVAFFRRSYFQRVWVLQENALAKEAQVFCGAVTFPARSLWDASTFLVRTEIGGDLRGMDQVVNSSNADRGFIGMTAFTIYCFQIFCQADSQSVFLSQFRFLNRTEDTQPDVVTLFQVLLLQTRGFRATDPRDHIFALLGIVKRVAEKRNLQPLSFPVDYSKSTSEIFRRAMVLILESTGWLAFLAYVPDSSFQNTIGFPSWVPDFSARAQTPLMWVADNKDVLRFDAGRVFGSARSEFRIDGGQLHLQARFLDVVADVGETASDIAESGVFEDIAKLILKCPETYTAGQDRIEVLWRTLIADQTPQSHPAPPALARSFSAWVKFTLMKALNSIIMRGQDVTAYVCERISIEILAQADETQILCGYQQVLEEVTEHADPAAADGTAAYRTMLQRQMLPFASVFSKIAAGRRLFRTESGWIGLGPQSLQVEDSVWILAAAPTPYVLRKAAGKPMAAYELVGEAYVHGAMHGEVLGSGVQQWKDIVLH